MAAASWFGGGVEGHRWGFQSAIGTEICRSRPSRGRERRRVPVPAGRAN
jgi:hypothetical protein